MTATNGSSNGCGFTTHTPHEVHARNGRRNRINRHTWFVARLCAQADAGQIDTVAFDMRRKTMTVSFLQAGKTAAGEQSYSVG